MNRTVAATSIVFALVAPAAIAAAASQAAAEVEITWDAPASCPTANVVMNEVRAILRESTGPARPVQARAKVTRAGRGFHVDLVVTSEGGRSSRAFNANSCEEIADAVALIAALAVDPTSRALPRDAGASAAPAAPDTASSATDGGSDSAASPDAAAQTRPSETQPGETQPGDRPARTAQPGARQPSPARAGDGPRLGVAAAFTGDIGSMPSFAPGVDVSLFALYGRTRAELHGALWGDQHAPDATRPAQGASLSLASMGARACYAVLASDRAARSGVALAPCAEFDVQRMSGAGVGASATRTGEAIYGAAGGGLVGTWALGSLVALRLDANVLAPISAPTFVALAPDGGVAGNLFRTSPAIFRLGIGVELRFF